MDIHNKDEWKSIFVTDRLTRDDGGEHVSERHEVGREDGKLIIGQAACELTGKG